MNIRIMSYNVKHCRNEETHEIDFDAVAGVIRRRGADIIGLNEIFDDAEGRKYGRQPGELAARLGFHAFFAPAIRVSGIPYGNALLSRFPILQARTVLIPDPAEPAYDGYYETRCVLMAEIDVAGGLRVCVSHFGLNPDEQINAFRTAEECIREDRCVLMGDMNLTPENPLLLPLRKRLFDTAEAFPAPRLSFPSQAPDRKIDYIFTSRDLEVLSADIPAETVSDHRPYLVQLRLPENDGRPAPRPQA